MAGNPTVWYEKAYGDNIAMLLQQKGTKLRDTVLVDTDFKAEYKFYNQIGSTEAIAKTSRFQNVPEIDADHQRRRVSKLNYVHPTFFDSWDALSNGLIDPTSNYAMSAVAALNRKLDDIIITAANGTAYSGQEGATPVTFPAAQQVASDSAHLTLDKILETQKILDTNEVDMDEEKFWIYGPEQKKDLLNLAEVKSADYNTIRALANGEPGTFMGFKWIMSNRLNVNGSSERLNLAYVKSALQLAVSKDITVEIEKRVDKIGTWQVLASMSMGAVRLEEGKIVEIANSEA
jgi:hypothetical protein